MAIDPFPSAATTPKLGAGNIKKKNDLNADIRLLECMLIRA